MRVLSTISLIALSALTTIACGPTTPQGVGGSGASGGKGGVGGTGGGGTGGTGGSPGASPCITKGSQVIVLGDSYMNLGDTAAMPHRYVENRARAEGALAANQSYRLYAQPGWSMGSGQIPSQLPQAIAADPDIKLVIMTGGGNDILIGARQCLAAGSSQDAQCQAVVTAAIDAARKMMIAGADAGIKDVVYLFYPHVVPGLLTGTAPNEMLDYALPRAKQLCDQAAQITGGRSRCTFVDNVPSFEGKQAQYIKSDGIHPTAAGAEVIGNNVWEAMKQNCIGQGPGSTCGCAQ